MECALCILLYLTTFTQHYLKKSSWLTCIAVICKFSLRYSIPSYAYIPIYPFSNLSITTDEYLDYINCLPITNNLAIHSLANIGRPRAHCCMLGNAYLQLD